MKTKQKYLDKSKKWKEDNKEKNQKTTKAWRGRNMEKIVEYGKEARDRVDYGGNRQRALERDNFECTKCFMSQEQHMILFNKSLTVDHIDGQGRYSEVKNNEMDNLQTLCLRCHGKKDGGRCMKKVWGNLLEQDDSEYKYPKIRKIIDQKKKELGSLVRAKQELADELEVQYFTIDHKYYDRKEGFLTGPQKRRLTKQGSKK